MDNVYHNFKLDEAYIQEFGVLVKSHVLVKSTGVLVDCQYCRNLIFLIGEGFLRITHILYSVSI